ncbi:hypothetical protein CPB86DRAFT_815327 [Serendipita vermifera]|nr:hypothetical protein CPB86DRAFT_815327 [Serendipita vermifera]
MPVITTYKNIYASFSTVDSASLASTAPSASISSSPSDTRAPLLLSTSDAVKREKLPTIIAIVVGILGALVLTVAACIVIRYRLRARRREAQFNENRRAMTNNTTTPQQPAPRLKPLSFLQGREGPKEWIPGGNGAKKSSGSMKRSSKRTLSLRKSFLSRASRISKLTIPQSANPANGPSDASSSGHGGAGLIAPDVDFNNIEMSSMQTASSATATATKYPPQSSIEQFQASGMRRRSSAALHPPQPQPQQQQQQRQGPVETTIKFERGLRVDEEERGGDGEKGTVSSSSSTAALIKALNIESPQRAKMPLPHKSPSPLSSPVALEFPTDRESKRVSRPMSTYQMWLAVAEQEEAEKKKVAAAVAAARTPPQPLAPASRTHVKTNKQVKPVLVNRTVPPRSKPITTNPDGHPTSIWFDDDDTDDMFSVPKRTIQVAP